MNVDKITNEAEKAAWREYARNWRRNHPEKVKEYSKKNRERYAEYYRQWRKEHLKEYMREWRKRHPEKRREYYLHEKMRKAGVLCNETDSD